MKELRVTDIRKNFAQKKGSITAVDGVSFTLRQGRCLALLGPSGCGKSTLLSLIAGFFPPDSGSIRREGSLALCMQEDMLLPWLELRDNLCLPARGKGRQFYEQYRQRAEALLPEFGLESFGRSYPAQLSGGMRQRAALLRMLLTGGDFWLLDEPFARLDALTKEDLQEMLLALMQREKPGVLLVTHDIDEALFLADEICLLTPRPAKVLTRITTPKGEGRSADGSELASIRQQIRALLRQSRCEAKNSFTAIPR